jgi:hypothetical protein
MGEWAGMTPDEARLRARARRAAFEVQPLVEAHDGQRVTVGFEVNLYAGLATEHPTARVQKLQPLEDALLDLGLRRGGWGA